MDDARRALVHYYRVLRRYGYNDSHSGNGSVRVGDAVWITPTGASGDTLDADALVACALGEEPSRQASLDAPLHLAVYGATAARAVLHSHGPHAIALSLSASGGFLEPVDFEGTALFPRIPVIDIPYGDYVRESPHRVAAALAEHRVTIVRGHGVYARGDTLEQAYRWNSQVEASARILWLARVAGTAD